MLKIKSLSVFYRLVFTAVLLLGVAVAITTLFFHRTNMVKIQDQQLRETTRLLLSAVNNEMLHRNFRTAWRSLTVQNEESSVKGVGIWEKEIEGAWIPVIASSTVEPLQPRFEAGTNTVTNLGAGEKLVCQEFFRVSPEAPFAGVCILYDVLAAEKNQQQQEFGILFLVALVSSSSLIFLGWLGKRQREFVLSLSSATESLLRGKRISEQDKQLLVDTFPAHYTLDAFRTEFENNLQDLRDKTQLAAVAQVTQMLAHDVRKPFTVLKMGLEMLAEVRNPEKIVELSQILMTDVHQSLKTVDGLIQDVMDFSSSTQVHCEKTSVCSLIEKSLFDTFQLYLEADIKITYSMKHVSLILVDRSKVMRIFSNILSNAVQAMRMKGSIWFKTNEVYVDKMKVIEICIGNSGSYIENEARGTIFESFFTKGKKQGTGLGLAIAQKMVRIHGGEIRCESGRNENYPEGYVEFYFSLPAGEEKDLVSLDLLPRESKEISKKTNLYLARQEVALGNSNLSEQQFESSLLCMLHNLGRKLRVLITDDERIYRDYMISTIEGSQVFSEFIEVETALNPNEAHRVIALRPFDFVILDVDLGKSFVNGFELTSKLRDEGERAFICIHSNRTLASDHRTAMECGADAFLPKPMSRSHLLKMVAHAAERASVFGKVGATEQCEPVR